MAGHMELLVEEPSMEVFLQGWLPRVLSADSSFAVHPFQGKSDLLGKLPDRLRAYARFLPEDWRVIVVVDRDDDDCRELKQRMEAMARQAGLRTRSQTVSAPWQIVNRIAVEELEAWYFGDWQAVREAYPRVSPNIRSRRAYRHPDAVAGGTWEAFERVMKRHGYFRQGLRKIEAARAVGRCVDVARSDSASFLCLHQAVMEVVG
jgi:hypothetical protein